eukprot:COSAG01_NODE_2690_length_7247_cov_30.101567_12_plen_216_part_00
MQTACPGQGATRREGAPENGAPEKGAPEKVRPVSARCAAWSPWLCAPLHCPTRQPSTCLGWRRTSMRMAKRCACCSAIPVAQTHPSPALPCPRPQQILLKVNKLSSTKTSLPYEFYKLPFCKPEEVSLAQRYPRPPLCTALTPRDFCGVKVQNYAENLGEVLRGDRIESSAYKMKMKNDRYCEVLCEMDYTKCVLAFVCGWQAHGGCLTCGHALR